MGKNQNSVVVLRIRLKFWWMIPMGVRDNHTKYEPETQRWRPGTGVANGHNSILGVPKRAVLLTIGCGISCSPFLSLATFAKNARSPGKLRFIAILGVFRLETQFRAKKSHFWAKTALEPIQNGQTKGKCGYTPRAA